MAVYCKWILKTSQRRTWHRDISKFITDPDLLQAKGDGGVYISNEDNYDIAVYLETCYASFDEVKPFIVFLATQICELDNAVQRFHRKKRIKKMGVVM